MSELDAAIARRAFHRLGGEDAPVPAWVPAEDAPARTTARVTPALLRAVTSGLDGRLRDEHR
ncbi:hypothetical protein ACFV0B_09185 [Streptomyces xanthophaeus]|uniref:hypothetical protein n=1 Tax=Streptomyces xanthophaeus TaxID=67385 RepID=UPI0036B2D1B7